MADRSFEGVTEHYERHGATATAGRDSHTQLIQTAERRGRVHFVKQKGFRWGEINPTDEVFVDRQVSRRVFL